jgi:hypothetical protein
MVTLLVYFSWVFGSREWERRGGVREFEQAVAETDALDPGWRWDDVQAARPRRPEGKNAADLIPRIKAALAKEWDRHIPDLDRAAAELPPNVRLPDRVRRDAVAALAASPEAVRLARGLKDLPDGGRTITLAANPFDTLLPDTQHTREVSQLLSWDARAAAEDGDSPAAGDDLAALLNTSRSIGDESFLISQLVRIATRTVAIRSAERVVAQTAGPDGLGALRLPALQAALARDLEEPLVLYAVRGDRASFDVLAGRLQDGTLTLGDLAPSERSVALSVGWWHMRARLPRDRAECLRWFNVAAAIAALPAHEQGPGWEGLTAPAVEGRILPRLLPAVDKVGVAHLRGVAEGRCAVAGLACERFRLTRGRWPAALDELCPAFLDAVPVDPFGGDPLRYTTLADGVVVHSAGPRPDPRFPPAVRPGMPDGVHHGFRLWNPDARRQPAPPGPDAEDQP